jgi:hypothetical protein
VYGARRILKNAPMILQSFFSLPKYESTSSMRWMAKWQEQEDGNGEKFQHNSVSKRLVSERVREGFLLYP